MSTTGYSDWAVDLANVTAVYPLPGWEVTMTVIGVIFWLGWHVVQFRREDEHLKQAQTFADKEKIAKALDRY